MTEKDYPGFDPAKKDLQKIIPCREREIVYVLELFKIHPFVFIWAPPGNGKTGFGREFCMNSPVPAQLILSSPLKNHEYPKNNKTYDSKINKNTKIVIVDEFPAPANKTEQAVMLENINKLIAKEIKLIFLLHEPKNSYLNWKRYKKGRRGHIVTLVEKYPKTPWIYLRKYKKTNH